MPVLTEPPFDRALAVVDSCVFGLDLNSEDQGPTPLFDAIVGCLVLRFVENRSAGSLGIMSECDVQYFTQIRVNLLTF